MDYFDKLYGAFKISDQVVLEIINCQAFKRLKGVDQAGYFEPYLKNTKLSRYEHSLGDYLLLKIHGASREEQIAGLIHDVSHAAFSHCIDYALEEGSPKNHSHQDNIFQDFVKNSEIGEIIEEWDFDLDYILDDRNFPLKENNIPDICSDRLDYSLRTAFNYGSVIKESDLKQLLANLTVVDKNWAFRSFAWAQYYARLFAYLNTYFYAGLPSALMFYTVGEYLKYSLKKGYISKKDLYTTDNGVINKINQHLSTDAQLDILWQRMNNKISVKQVANNYDAQIFVKSRSVDPYFLDNGKLVRYSSASPSWKQVVEIELKPKRYLVKYEK